MASTLINKNFEFRPIKYVCPLCKEVKSLKTPTSSIKNNEVALISISEGIVCKHSFLAEIDRDFMQRSSYIPDFILEMQKEDDMPSISRRIKLDILSTNFRRILIKKACTIINSIVKLGFAIAIRITRRILEKFLRLKELKIIKAKSSILII